MLLLSIKEWVAYDTILNYPALPDDCIEISIIGLETLHGMHSPVGMRLVKHKYPFEFEPVPAISIEQLNTIERNWRDTEISIYVDHFQKRLVWDDLAVDEQIKVSGYRRALLDYPSSVEFKSQTRPSRPNSPLLK